MFTLKLYSHNGWRQKIVEAESFTVLRNRYTHPSTKSVAGEALAEITAHFKGGDGQRFDIQVAPGRDPNSPVTEWEKAIIENSAGRTTEIIGWNIPPLNCSNSPETAKAA